MNSTVFGWLVVIGVIALVWVAVRQRAATGGFPARGGSVPRPTGPRPQPRQIWWGRVPGEGDCPFLVLEARDRSVTGLPITLRRDLADRDDYLSFRPESGSLKPGALSLHRRTIDLNHVRNRADTPCPAELWTSVKAYFSGTQQQGGPRSTSRPRDHRG